MIKSKNSVEKNYLYNLIYQLLIVFIPLVTTPYVSRVLAADGVGAFSYTSSVASYFVLLSNLGVATYGQLNIAKLRNKKYEMSKLFFELIVFKIIAMIIVIILYFILIFYFGELEYKNLYYILVIQIVANSIDISWLLQGLEEFKTIVFRNTIIKILSLILIFTLVNKQSDLFLYAFIMTGSTLAGNLSIWFFIPKYIQISRFTEFHPFRHFKAVLIYFIPTIATALYLTLDKTMLGLLTSNSFENGYYEQANKIEQMVVTIVTSVSVVTMPRMAYLFNNNEIEKMKLRLSQTVQFILMISIPMCFGLYSISDYFIPLFLGSGYEKSIILLKIFSFLIIIVGLNNAIGKQVLMPIGRQREYNMSVIVGTIVNCILNLFLIKSFYSIGASLASVTAETIILLLFIYYSKDFISVQWIFGKSIKFLISSLIMTGFITYMYNFLPMTWFSMLTQIAGGILIYFIMLLILKEEFFISSINLVLGKLNYKR